MQDEIRNASSGVDASVAGETLGTPGEDIGTWDGKQSYDDTCAIRCQEFILEQFTGQEISEDALIQQAQDNGWYQPGVGTLPQDVGNLLEANGVPATQYENATPHDLAKELAQGHKVVIGIDSGELWGEENPIMEDLASMAPVDGADHAVVVSGIDTTDPDNPQVIISDPGTGEAAAHYPLDQFMASWQDSNFFMTATEDPAPPTAPEMVNFDYEEGHIPEVAGMPYDEFVALNDNLERFNELLEQILETIGVDVPDDQGPDTVDGDIVDQTSVEQDVFVDQTVPNQDGVAQPVDPAEAAPAAEDGQPIEVNISDMNIQVNEGDGTFAPEETGDVITPGGGGPADPAVPVDFYVDPAGPVAPGIDVDQTVMDQNLFDPAAPGPTLPVDLFDPAAPGPTLPIELLDPAAPGPTLDPALLDPEMPGPTLDPILLDPTAPGPTLNPALLDPSAPGPTLDPALVDPASPGPTLPPELLDPTAPGPTLDPALLDPEMPGPTLEPAMLDPMSPGPVLDPALLDPTSPGPTLDPDLLDPEAPGPTLDPAQEDTLPGMVEEDGNPETIDMDPNTAGEQIVLPALDLTNPTNPASPNSPFNPFSPSYIDPTYNPMAAAAEEGESFEDFEGTTEEDLSTSYDDPNDGTFE